MSYLNLPLPNNDLGYTREEVIKIINSYNISEELFWDKFGVNTMCSENGITYYFECDVDLAIRLCLENREMRSYEWD